MSNIVNIRSMFHNRFIVLFLMMLQFSIAIGQTPWNVPEDKKAKLSPVMFNDSIRKHGKEIFQANCISCHGQPGMGNVAQLLPPPPDPVSEKMQKNSDGEMFFKISEGRGQMSSFKNVLTPDEIWDVISYFRSFNKNYVQRVEEKIEKTGYGGVVKILLTLVDTNKKIQAEIFGTKESITEPLANIEVKLFARRWFGNLQIDESKLSNSDGKTLFAVPKNLPGDSIGRIHIMAVLSDQELYGRVKVDTFFTVGTPANMPALTEKRAMWNVMSKAPVWLLIAYFGGVLAAWGTIFYILLQIRKISLIGKQ
jgi:hypothetical protein